VTRLVQPREWYSVGEHNARAGSVALHTRRRSMVVVGIAILAGLAWTTPSIAQPRADPQVLQASAIADFSKRVAVYVDLTKNATQGLPPLYFVSGAAGQLRAGDIGKSDMTAAGFDADRSFMLVEVAGKELSFQAISRIGKTVDKGTIFMRETVRTTAAAGVPSVPAAIH
jgi:hypothetical protein